RKKAADATALNYLEHVSDTVGLRALHLFKDHWRVIHDFVVKSWKPNEPPLARYRRGDPGELLKEYQKRECKLKEDEQGYSSIHYNVQPESKEIPNVEIQVRTIFEEGWTEINHRFTYSRPKEHLIFDPFLRVF